MEPRPGPHPAVVDEAAGTVLPIVVPPPVVRSLHRSPGTTLLVLSGELDVASAEQLAPLAGSCGGPGQELVVDAGGLTFLDCAGLRAVLAIARPGGGVRWSRTSRAVDLLLGALQLRPARVTTDLTAAAPVTGQSTTTDLTTTDLAVTAAPPAPGP